METSLKLLDRGLEDGKWPMLQHLVSTWEGLLFDWGFCCSLPGVLERQGKL